MEQRTLVFVGSYAEADSSGLYVYSFDEKSGQLTKLDDVSGLKNPTFINVDIDHKKLYSIGECAAEDGTKTAEAVSFAIDTDSGKLTQLNRVFSLDAPTCHIQRDSNSRYLIVSSYHGGRIGLLALEENGQVGRQLDVQQHVGQGPHPNQNQARAHSAFFSPDEQYVYVSDLGSDRVKCYSIDKQRNVLVPQGEYEVPAGSGPRHLTFHPNGRFVYVINELNSTVSVFSYHSENGELRPIETVSTLPANYDGENGCAEIAISEDGKYLYGSNRGHDSIVVYAVHPDTGKLTTIEYVSTEGGHPRHFALTPGGSYLLAANRDSNNIAVFHVDRATGKIAYTGHSVQVSKPVCVKPVYVNS
ncbi:lactonase family protein [Paenibacillus alvei]|uniref:Lactonase family protein n=1 Tax=Paenibacillus alvei TaxID=44250 RepID=A0ABT4GY93_PAEAL|nr:MULTISPECIES: lactonase family protein [Paenibacillus]EJW16188.1 3-carboxymuconate cyclase [Paenibacillus alvei DSM 29]MCY7482996.1 lactonase family protein [Paenibacillus alvei]MCY9543454.1 lactonase family protein [Paenibacillus alvei]MCY9704475.1 lactonase family protein [Paenibacillus alvei]MCY9732864.1 lactonase family protein [Paenibacillus alvei]